MFNANSVNSASLQVFQNTGGPIGGATGDCFRLYDAVRTPLTSHLQLFWSSQGSAFEFVLHRTEDKCQTSPALRFWQPMPWLQMSSIEKTGVTVYLAPPPPRQLAPREGKLSRDILPPALVIFTPGEQAVQASLSCPLPPHPHPYRGNNLTDVFNLSTIYCNIYMFF